MQCAAPCCTASKWWKPEVHRSLQKAASQVGLSQTFSRIFFRKLRWVHERPNVRESCGPLGGEWRPQSERGPLRYAGDITISLENDLSGAKIAHIPPSLPPAQETNKPIRLLPASAERAEEKIAAWCDTFEKVLQKLWCSRPKEKNEIEQQGLRKEEKEEERGKDCNPERNVVIRLNKSLGQANSQAPNQGRGLGSRLGEWRTGEWGQQRTCYSAP